MVLRRSPRQFCFLIRELRRRRRARVSHARILKLVIYARIKHQGSCRKCDGCLLIPNLRVACGSRAPVDIHVFVRGRMFVYVKSCTLNVQPQQWLQWRDLHRPFVNGSCVLSHVRFDEVVSLFAYIQQAVFRKRRNAPLLHEHLCFVWREVDAVARKIEIRGFIVKLGNDLPNELDFDLRRYSKNEWTPAWTPASGNSFNRDTLPGAMNRRVDKATRE